jgi:plasmid stabilization system protein ParE
VSRSLELRPEARQDLEDAAAWYEGEKPGLGLRFLDVVDQTLAQILENPEGAAVWEKEPRLRRCIVPRFPYLVCYEVDGDVVRIVAIAHGRRRPGYWST